MYENFNIQDLGIIDYRRAIEIQLDLLAKRQASAICDTVLLLEHPPVITFGARRNENRLTADESVIKSRGIDIIEISRGGAATAHNPGQLVIYPIIDLKRRNIGVNEFVRKLEQLGMDLLAEMGVKTQRKKGRPGIWAGERKIASIGVQIKKWVSFHGMAINICNDIAIFDMIVPCGLDGVQMTSVQIETGRASAVEDAKRIIIPLIENWLKI